MIADDRRVPAGSAYGGGQEPHVLSDHTMTERRAGAWVSVLVTSVLSAAAAVTVMFRDLSWLCTGKTRNRSSRRWCSRCRAS